MSIVPEDNGQHIIFPKGETPDQSPWDKLLSEARNHPIISRMEFASMIRALNTKMFETRYRFVPQSLVDDRKPLNVADWYEVDDDVWQQPIISERISDNGQKLLDMMPDSVRSGSDDQYCVWEMRLDNLDSLEHFLGTTTLIMRFIEDRTKENKCYLFGVDADLQNWQKNWSALQEMYQEHFPNSRALSAGEEQ